MLQRLHRGFKTRYDVEFYYHELKESEMFSKTNDLAGAHKYALQSRNVVEKDLFHPDVVKELKELFPVSWSESYEPGTPSPK